MTPHAIISFPFRLTPHGDIALVVQSSDEGNAEQLAVLVLTRRGERPLAPAFGVTDPVFRTLAIGDLIAGVSLFGPPVNIRSATTSYPDDSTEEVRVAFA